MEYSYVYKVGEDRWPFKNIRQSLVAQLRNRNMKRKVVIDDAHQISLGGHLLPEDVNRYVWKIYTKQNVDYIMQYSEKSNSHIMMCFYEDIDQMYGFLGIDYKQSSKNTIVIRVYFLPDYPLIKKIHKYEFRYDLNKTLKKSKYRL